MLFKKIKFVLILLLFYQTPLYSKSNSFEDFDSRSWAQKINGIFYDDIRIRKISKNAKETVLSNYKLEVLYEFLNKITTAVEIDMDIALKLSVMFKSIKSRRKSTNKKNINIVLNIFNDFKNIGFKGTIKR